MDKEIENSGVIPESEPLPDEIAAIMKGRKDREENGTVSHDEIDWE